MPPWPLCYPRGMGYFKATRPSEVIYAAALLGLLVGVAATKIFDFDIWWHLATGWVIATMHEIPRYDLFSYTAFGAPWVNHEWLFQLAAWLLFQGGGIAWLTALKFGLTGAIAFVLFRTIELLARSRSAALWGTFLFLWADALRILERPFLVGLLLLALFCLVLHQEVLAGTKALFALPLIEVLWVNTHGGALIGPLIVLAFAAGETVNALLPPRWGGPSPIPADRRRHLWIAGAGCVAAATINPWGIDTLLFPFRHIEMRVILEQTQEWLPLLHPFLDYYVLPLFAIACLALTLAAMAADARRVRLSSLFAIVLLSVPMAKSHRFAPDFLVVAIPIGIASIAGVARRTTSRRIEGFLPAWIGIGAAFLLSCGAILYGVPVKVTGERLSDVGIGTSFYSSPARMVDFLETHGIHGRVLNEMGLGGYLLFRRWPGERVFLDGRTPVYGDRFYEDYVDIFRTERNFRDLDRRYRFDYIVFSGFQLWQQRHFHLYLWESPEWRLVYAGRDGFVYLRDEPRFAALIEELALTTNPLVGAIRKEEERQRPPGAEPPPAVRPARWPAAGCALVR